MAPIYQEIQLKWEGEEYTIQPSFRMVQEIEAGRISISGVIRKMALGEPQMSQVSEIIAFMLKSGVGEKLPTQLGFISRSVPKREGDSETPPFRHHAGNRQDTARTLGINRTTLFNKMRKYDLLSFPHGERP